MSEAITFIDLISDFWPPTSDLLRRLIRPNEIVSGVEKISIFLVTGSHACQAACSRTPSE